MKRFLNKWFILVSLLVATIILYVFLMALTIYNRGYNAGQESIEPVFVDRPVPVEKIVTQNVTEYVDRKVIVRVEVPYQLSGDRTISLNEALAILTMAKASHAYMVLHPELQNANTGNTTFNLEWIDNYDKADNFIKWQVNRIKQLEEIVLELTEVTPPITPPIYPPVISPR